MVNTEIRLIIFFAARDGVASTHPQTWQSGSEAEAQVLWPHDAKSQLIGKDTDAGGN